MFVDKFKTLRGSLFILKFHQPLYAVFQDLILFFPAYEKDQLVHLDEIQFLFCIFNGFGFVSGNH
jgi:hypothetical protein